MADAGESVPVLEVVSGSDEAVEEALRGERDLRCARRDALREDFDYPFLGFRVLKEEKTEPVKGEATK